MKPGTKARRKLICVLALCLVVSSPLAAQDASPETPAVRLGKVRLDREKRRVSFPAVFNMTEGLLEYVLVGSQGKVHESLLRTDVQPTQLHTAMLLFGVKTGERHPGAAPPAAIDADYLRSAPALRGDPVTVWLKWTTGGKETTCRAEELVFNTDTKATATVGDWTYNGSMFDDDNRFLAEQEKSFVALVTDPAALVNNPRPGHDNDQIWFVAKDKVPPKDTPVEVTLELKPANP